LVHGHDLFEDLGVVEDKEWGCKRSVVEIEGDLSEGAALGFDGGRKDSVRGFCDSVNRVS
jgi:hypothetical protein